MSGVELFQRAEAGQRATAEGEVQTRARMLPQVNGSVGASRSRTSWGTWSTTTTGVSGERREKKSKEGEKRRKENEVEKKIS